MNFYNREHRYYCGIDLHARTMYVCILDQAGEILVHQNLPAEPAAFLKVIAAYRDDIAVAVECIFTWYWLADLCQHAQSGREHLLEDTQCLAQGRCGQAAQPADQPLTVNGSNLIHDHMTRTPPKST